MHRKAFLAAAVVGCLCTIAQASTTVTVGNHNLLPNTAGQKISITVSSDTNDRTAGIAARVGIGDQVAGGEPTITAVDVITGTIFAPSNTGQSNAFSNGNTRWSGGTTTNNVVNVGDGPGIVAIASSSLAMTVTIDTTGIVAGVFPVQLAWLSPVLNTQYTNTGGQFPNVTTIRVNGTVTIVPEPSSVMLGLFAAAGLGAVVIRRRKARKA